MTLKRVQNRFAYGTLSFQPPCGRCFLGRPDTFRTPRAFTVLLARANWLWSKRNLWHKRDKTSVAIDQKRIHLLRRCIYLCIIAWYDLRIYFVAAFRHVSLCAHGFCFISIYNQKCRPSARLSLRVTSFHSTKQSEMELLLPHTQNLKALPVRTEKNLLSLDVLWPLDFLVAKRTGLNQSVAITSVDLISPFSKSTAIANPEEITCKLIQKLKKLMLIRLATKPRKETKANLTKMNQTLQTTNQHLHNYSIFVCHKQKK